MKKLFALMALVGVGAAPASFAAQTSALDTIRESHLATILSTVTPFDLINWKVGDSGDYKISLGGGLPLSGSMHKEVTKEEGAAIWVHQDVDLMIQKDSSDMLMNRADGKILKYIHNGKEEQVPDEQIEVISQEYTSVTVPAGTFKAIHITAKSKQVDKMEVWANPKDTCMDGSLKMVMSAQGTEITMELTKFNRTP